MLLLQVISLFEKEGIEHLVSGGYALCLNGAVRPTLDIDVLIPSQSTTFRLVEWCLAELDLSYFPEDSDSVKKVFRKSATDIVTVHLDSKFHSYRSRTIKAHSHQIEVIHPLDLIQIKSKHTTEQNQHDILALKLLASPSLSL